MLETRFPFLYPSNSLGTKTLTIISNGNFESCISVSIISTFSVGNFAHYQGPLANHHGDGNKDVAKQRFNEYKIV